MIGRIRNTFLRRSLLIATYLPMMLAAALLGGLEGAVRDLKELHRVFKNVWGR